MTAAGPQPLMGLSPLAATVDRFLVTYFPSKKSRFLVACSGGADSVALVHALGEIARARKLHVEIGHVNHGLRGKESNGDQRFVEKLAGDMGWPIHIARCPVPSAGNVEERARESRYKALFSTARRRRLQAVLTAHTVGDQAETVLMNLFRGSGAEGLAGMRPLRVDSAGRDIVARPLLTVDRAVVRAYGQAKGPFRTDRSNSDQKFFRNYVRLNLFEQVNRRVPGFEQRIARLAELLRDELPILEGLADKAHHEVGQPYKGGWLLDRRRFDRLPVAIQRRVLRRAAGRDLLTFDGVEGLRSWLASPPKSGRVWQLRKGWVVERLSKSGGSPSPTMFWFRQTPSASKRARTLESKKGR